MKLLLYNARKTKRPLLYDVFCCAGGCTKGYQRAGFYVIGVDKDPQKNYCGDDFIQMDALEFLEQLIAGLWPEPVAISASPPCQVYSVTAPLSNGNHPDLIEPVRELIAATGKPYVIENVPGAPLINPLMLCGTMFGLRVRRHRLFECEPAIWWPPMSCNHWSKIGENGFCCLAGDGSGNSNKYPAHSRRVKSWQAATEIDWMIKREMAQAIPPAYTEFIGQRLMELIRETI